MDGCRMGDDAKGVVVTVVGPVPEATDRAGHDDSGPECRHCIVVTLDAAG